MRLLNTALFVCVVVGQVASTVAVNNDCTGPPPQYNNSTFDHCTEQRPGGCNCTVANQTCLFGDRLFYNCSHDTELDFLIVCNYKDAQGNRYGWVVDNVTEKFENCTGSEAPVQETTKPRPTASPFLGCIRLVESQTTPNETSGILQMYNDTWGSVCYTAAWNRPTLANITCKMLGFSSSFGLGQMQLPIHQKPQTISTDAWEVNIVHCSEEDQTLWDCDLAENSSDWLTFVEFGSDRCPSLLKISCKGNTTLSNLTYCPPTTTTPTTTTSGPTAAYGNEPPANTGLSTGAVIAIVVVVVLLLLILVCCCACNGSGRNKRKQRKVKPTSENRRAAGITGSHLREPPSIDNNFTAVEEPLHGIARLSQPSDDRDHNQLTIDERAVTTVQPTETETATETEPRPSVEVPPRANTGPIKDTSENSPATDDNLLAQTETQEATDINEPEEEDLKTKATEDTEEGDTDQSANETTGTDVDQKEVKEHCDMEAPNTAVGSTEVSVETENDPVIEELPEATSSPTGRCSILSSDAHRAAWTEATDGPSEGNNTQPTAEQTVGVRQTGKPGGRLSFVTDPTFLSDQRGPIESPFHDHDNESPTEDKLNSARQSAREQDDLTEEDL